MKGLAPLAAALVVFGFVAWQTISQEMAIGPWLLAAFLVGHGLVHTMYLIPTPAPAPAGAARVDFPFVLGRSWLLSRLGVEAHPVRVVGLVLIGATVAGFTLAGLATVGLLVPSDWWSGLVITASTASIALLGLFFQPGLILGLAIDGVLLAVVLVSGWSPTAS
jgi:hypothetical protein